MTPTTPPALHWAALSVGLAITITGCGDKDADDTGVVEEVEEITFSESSELMDSEAPECAIDLYWPAAMTHFPVAVFPVDAPEPPYEITGFGGELWEASSAFDDGRKCSPELGLRVFAFVGDAPPTGFEDNADGMPQTTVLAEAVLSAAAPSEDWSTVVASVTLDTPVLVEEEGTLWIGYDASLDPGKTLMGGDAEDDGACAAGCSAGDGSFWVWMADDNNFGSDGGWQERADQNALVSVTINHN